MEPYVGVSVVAGSRVSLIFKCPSDYVGRSSSGTPRSYAVNNAYGTSSGGSNGIDQGLIGPRLTPPGSSIYPMVTSVKVISPATTILLAEAIKKGNRLGQIDRNYVNKPYQTGTNTYGQNGEWASTEPDKALHFEGWNYLFCDGHVKWHKPAQTVDLNPTDIFMGSVSSQVRGMWTMDEDD